MNQPAGAGFHVASLAHVGRIWDAYLEFDDHPDRTDVFRARLRFEPADAGENETPVHTGLLIIEHSYEDAVTKARSFERPQLEGLLRSALPEERDKESEPPGVGLPADDGTPEEGPAEAVADDEGVQGAG